MNSRLARVADWRFAPCLPVAVAFLCFLLLTAMRHRGTGWVQRKDLLDRRMQILVPDGVDCGRVGIHGDPSHATQCTLAAFNAHKAFRVRFDKQGIDSDVADGLVGTADGTVTTLMFDGDPSGGGGTSLFGQRVTPRPCPVPAQLFETRDGRLTCFPSSPTS
jgi:hypothetical protein